MSKRPVPLSEMIDTAGIMEELGISRYVFEKIKRDNPKTFPKPVRKHGMKYFYAKRDVKRFKQKVE